MKLARHYIKIGITIRLVIVYILLLQRNTANSSYLLSRLLGQMHRVDEGRLANYANTL